MRNVATKYAIVHIRESSPMRVVLTAAQGECPVVTRHDLYNAVRAFKMAGNLEMVADSVLPEALEGQSPAVQSPAVQSPAVITMSVEDATQAVQDKKMRIRAAAIACSLSKGTFCNRGVFRCTCTDLFTSLPEAPMRLELMPAWSGRVYLMPMDVLGQAPREITKRRL